MARLCFANFSLLIVGLGASLLSGCGGGSTNFGGSVGSIGSVSFNVVGTAQAPVNRAGGTIAISGVAGATLTDILYSDYNSQPLLFTSDENGSSRLFMMNQTSGQRAYMLDSTIGGPTADPEMMPGGKEYVFAMQISGIWQIVLAPFGLTGNYGSIGTSSFNSEHPYPAPNGAEIYFDCNSDGNKEIWKMDSAEGNRTQITTTANTVTNRNPVISPDGKWLAFESDRDGNFEIYLKRFSSGVETRITNSAGDDVEPMFHPNNLHLVWSSNRTGDYNLYRALYRNGALVTQLNSESSNERQPSFSADGNKIFFTSDRDDTAAPVTTEIYSMAANGTGQTRISVDSSFNQKSPSLAGNISFTMSALGLTNTCSGIIASQSVSGLVSLLQFDISTPSDANRGLTRVTSDTLPGTAVSIIFYTISTPTTLNAIRWTKPGMSFVPVANTIIPPTAATNALVSYSTSGTNAGQVISVMPYAANRSGVTKRAVGNTTVVEGTFPAVYDANGKNLAPNGASQVTFDSNGAVISWH